MAAISFLSMRWVLAVFAIVMLSALGVSDSILAAIRASRWLDVLKAVAFPVLFCGMAVYILMFSGYNARRMLRNQPSLRGVWEAEFTGNGFRLANRIGGGENQWAAVNEVVETKSLFLLKLGPQVATVVPKRAFTGGQLEEFRGLVREAGKGPKSGGLAGRWS